MSKELTALKQDFKKHCPNIKIIKTIEEKDYKEWNRLVFESLNCDELIQIGTYIQKKFSIKDKFSHKLPKLHSYNGHLCLTISKSQIKNAINYE